MSSIPSLSASELPPAAPAPPPIAPLFLQRKRRAGSDGVASAAAAPAAVVAGALEHSVGQPLPVAIRAQMEQAFGVDFAHVRVHADGRADAASRAAAAEAFTYDQSIYFSAGSYRPESPAGRVLLAHELAHVVQNRQTGAALPARASLLSVSAPDDAAEIEADCAARAIAAGHAFTVRGSAGARVQRKGLLDGALDWGSTTVDRAESAVASGAHAVVEFTGDQLMQLVRAAAPELGAIIDEGPVNFAKRKVSEALDAHMPDALGGFSLNDLASGVSGWLGKAAAFAKGLFAGDPDCCKSFASAMQTLTDFVTSLIDNPVVAAINDALGKATDFVGRVLKVIGEPLFDGLKQYVAGAWKALTKVVGTVSSWIGRAKQALGDLWNRFTSILGFDGSSEGGLWAWIKDAAAKVWDGIRSALAPVIEPLKKVASAVALLTPMGQVHAIVKYGPKLVKVAQWLWENGLSPEKIREAPADIKGMLQSLSGGVGGFKDVLKTGLGWLADKLSTLGDALLGAAQAMSGLPLISFAHGLFDNAKQVLQQAVTAIEQGAKNLLADVESGVKQVEDFIAPYKEVISSLILAIAAPPTIPLILAGWAWRALPSCVKVPIIDFILDIAITAVTKLPDLPIFGPLWLLLKPAVVAFFGTLRIAKDEVKEQVADRIAKVMSGASPDFLIGFVKGFAQGVWEGITDPIKAIWSVLEGLDTATQYLLSLAGAADTQATPAPTDVAEAGPVQNPDESAAPQAGAREPALTVAPESIDAVKAQAAAAATAIYPDVAVVKGGFWDAVEDYFNGGSMGFDEMVTRLSGAWESAKTKIAAGGAWLANQLLQFFQGKAKDTAAEGELGDKIGWLSGSVVFQVLLDFITAGTWAGAGPVLKGIAKLINWPMEFLGEAFKLLKTLGKYLVEGIKTLGSAIKEAASGAFKAVSHAVGSIGEKLIAFGEEIVAKFGGKAAKAEAKGAGVLSREGRQVAEDAVKASQRETARVTEKNATKDLIETSEQKASPAAQREVAHESEQEAAKTAENESQKEVEKKTEKDGQNTAEKNAKKEAELGAAEAEAKSIMSADSAADLPVTVLMAQLIALKLEFRWIETFEVTPKAPGRFAVDMIASDHPLGEYRTKFFDDRSAKLSTRVDRLVESENVDRYLAETGQEYRLTEIEELANTDPEATEKLVQELENDVQRAQRLVDLSKRFPKLSELDLAAMERIVAKGSDLNKVKGQLLEELLNVRMLKPGQITAHVPSELAEKLAAKGTKLEFIPGHAILDSRGKMISDGLIGYWENGRLHVVTFFEAKSGAPAARGLRRAWTGIPIAERPGILNKAQSEGLAAFRNIDQNAAEALSEAAQAVKDSRRIDATLDNVLQQYPEDVQREWRKLPQGEAGQIRKTTERLDQLRLNVFGEDVEIATAGASHAVAVLPSDVKAASLEKALGSDHGENIKSFQRMKDVDVDQTELAKLAGEIAKVGSETEASVGLKATVAPK